MGLPKAKAMVKERRSRWAMGKGWELARVKGWELARVRCPAMDWEMAMGTVWGLAKGWAMERACASGLASWQA